MLRTCGMLIAGALLAGSLFLVRASAQDIETVVFFDDFQSSDPIGTILPDSPPIGEDWIKFNGNSTDSFIAANPESQTRNNSSLVYSMARPEPPTSGVGVAIMIAPIAEVHQDLIESNGSATIEFKYYDTGQQFGMSLIANEANPGAVPTGFAAAGLDFSGGMIKQAGFGASNLTHLLNDWNDIRLDFDFDAQEYTVSVNGVMGSSAIPFLDEGRSSLTNLWLSYTSRPSHYYIDDVRISTVGPPPPTLREWTTNGSGVWTDLNNWTPGFVPNADDIQALFGAAIAAPSTVAVDTDVTVNTIEFNNANTYVLAGPGSITLAGANPSITATSGDHQLQVRVALDADTAAGGTGGSVDFNNEIDLGGNTLTTSGTVNINHSAVSSGGAGSIVNSGTLGTAGSTSISGNLTSTGALEVDISGTGIGQIDLFNITGSANLEGMVNVDVLGAFAPTGDITILTAAAGINLTGSLLLDGPDAGLFSGVSVVGNNLVLNVGGVSPTGDYNGNGVVDAADYTVWRDTLNQNVMPGSGADGDQSGIIDQDDYAFWKSRFGNIVSGSASGTNAGAAVPEPMSCCLLLVGSLGIAVTRNRPLVR